MTYANIFTDSIMPLMPEGAEQIINEQADYYSTSISWKLNNDPKRPNKRSKTIAIIISREAVDDFSEMQEKMKEQVISRLESIIKQKLSIIDEAWIQKQLREQGHEIKCYNLNDFPTNSWDLRDATK